MSERVLSALQRITAAALAPLVVVHLILIVIAVRDGLTAGEILARTQGSVGWALFYGLFVLAAAIHAPIGVRAILQEWSVLTPKIADWVAAAFGVILLFLGLRAVVAVVG